MKVASAMRDVGSLALAFTGWHAIKPHVLAFLVATAQAIQEAMGRQFARDLEKRIQAGGVQSFSWTDENGSHTRRLTAEELAILNEDENERYARAAGYGGGLGF